jgi:hypothetical protein
LRLSLTEVTQAPVSSTLAEVALGPIRLDADRLLGILEGFLVLVLRGVDGGAVGVEDLVLGINSNSLCELLTIEISLLMTALQPTFKSGVANIHRSRIVLGREGLVAFSLQSVSHYGNVGIKNSSEKGM